MGEVLSSANGRGGGVYCRGGLETLLEGLGEGRLVLQVGASL